MEKLIPFAIYIGVVITVLLFIREIALWYWKVNESLSELKKMNLNLTALLKHYGVEPPTPEKEKEPWWKDKPSKQ